MKLRSSILVAIAAAALTLLLKGYYDDYKEEKKVAIVENASTMAIVDQVFDEMKMSSRINLGV